MRSSLQRDENADESLPRKFGRGGFALRSRCSSGRLHQANAVLATGRHRLQTATILAGNIIVFINSKIDVSPRYCEILKSIEKSDNFIFTSRMVLLSYENDEYRSGYKFLWKSFEFVNRSSASFAERTGVLGENDGVRSVELIPFPSSSLRPTKNIYIYPSFPGYRKSWH